MVRSMAAAKAGSPVPGPSKTSAAMQSATQKIIVKHRSDFEVIFPADKKVTCDFLIDRYQCTWSRQNKLSDDDCEQLGVTYKDEIFTIVDSACYKIVRTLDYHRLVYL